MGLGMNTFRTLDLAVEFYKQAEALKLSGNLRDQLSRAASSIALNLSEGNAKHTVPEKKRYYLMAYASQKECQTILKLLEKSAPELEQLLNTLGAHLFRLIKSELKTIQNTEYS